MQVLADVCRMELVTAVLGDFSILISGQGPLVGDGCYQHSGSHAFGKPNMFGPELALHW